MCEGDAACGKRVRPGAPLKKFAVGGAGLGSPSPAGQCGGVPSRPVPSCDTPYPTRATHELYEPLGSWDWMGEGRGEGDRCAVGNRLAGRRERICFRVYG